MDEVSEYRSWEQREADAALTKAQAEQAKVAAEQARQDLAGNAASTKTRQMAEQLKQQRLAQQMAEQLEDGKDKAGQRKQRRAEERADSGHAFKRMTLIAVVTLLAVALPAQVQYFLGLHKQGQGSHGPAWLMAPAPLGLELLAWVGVAGTSWARRKGLPLWPFWLMTAGLASFAAAVNFSHTTAEFGPIAGTTLGGFSLLAPMLWELREWMDARAAVDGRDRQQRATDKQKAKAAAEQAKLDRAHDEKRRKTEPKTWAEFERILITAPRGTVDREAAWRDAWYRVHRAPLGYTAETYRAMAVADGRLDEVLELMQERSVYRELDRALIDLFGGDDDGGIGTLPSAPSGKPSGGPAEARIPLGRKGKKPSALGSRKTPHRPLDPEHIGRVRKLAEALGGTAKLSLRNVREAIGGGSNEYAIRLRDAVRSETD
jgi:hypothetical protein